MILLLRARCAPNGSPRGRRGCEGQVRRMAHTMWASSLSAHGRAVSEPRSRLAHPQHRDSAQGACAGWPSPCLLSLGHARESRALAEGEGKHGVWLATGERSIAVSLRGESTNRQHGCHERMDAGSKCANATPRDQLSRSATKRARSRRCAAESPSMAMDVIASSVSAARWMRDACMPRMAG